MGCVKKYVFMNIIRVVYTSIKTQFINRISLLFYSFVVRYYSILCKIVRL